jgi:hypothetical protein
MEQGPWEANSQSADEGNSSLHSLLHPSVTASLLSSNLILNILQSEPLSVFLPKYEEPFHTHAKQQIKL